MKSYLQAKCGSLNKNGPQRLILECLVTREWNYLKELEGLGGVALLVKVCCQG